MGQYFSDQQLDELERAIKTVPVDGEGRVQSVQYEEHFVRGTILKLIADNRNQKEWIATVINHYNHVMEYGICKIGANMFVGGETDAQQ